MGKEKLNIALVGYGLRGWGMLIAELLPLDDVNVVAICDLYEDRIERAVGEVKAARNGYVPFTSTDYHEVVTRPDVDAVFIYAAWEEHVNIACAALEAGKCVALEVGGAYSVADCQRLVDTVERTKMPFMFLENCCYDERELAITNMVRDNVFGEIVHCKGGYKHDLRGEIIQGGLNLHHYRLRNYIGRNCDNYPTHELGPICKLLDINNGNRMVRLSSFASKARGLHDFVERAIPENKEMCDTVFQQGDVVNTIITCANGETILLTLDTSMPHTYCRDFTVEGTRGFYSEESHTFYLDKEPEYSDWWKGTIIDGAPADFNAYKEKYASPLWSNKEELKTHGHGGMDAICHRAAIDCFKDGTYPPIDIYDAVNLMVITPLSAESIRNGGMPVDIPDFTGGHWQKRVRKASGAFALDR